MQTFNAYSVCYAITFFLMYSAYALGFWYGSQMVQNGSSTPGNIFTVSWVKHSFMSCSKMQNLVFGRLRTRSSYIWFDGFSVIRFEINRVIKQTCLQNLIFLLLLGSSFLLLLNIYNYDVKQVCGIRLWTP